MQYQSFDFLIVVILLELQGVDSNVVSLRLPELLALAKLPRLIFDDFFLYLHKRRATSP